MSKIEKLVERFQMKPKDLTWNELVKILKHYSYEEITTGKTAGSRRAFGHEETKHIIRLHEPHPGNIIKQYQIKEVLETLGLDN